MIKFFDELLILLFVLDSEFLKDGARKISVEYLGGVVEGGNIVGVFVARINDASFPLFDAFEALGKKPRKLFFWSTGDFQVFGRAGGGPKK